MSTGLRVPCPGCEKQAAVVELNGGQWYALRCETPGCPHRGAEVVHHAAGRPVPSVAQAVADATAALRANPDDNIAASVLWLAYQLDQATGNLTAALAREEQKDQP